MVAHAEAEARALVEASVLAADRRLGTGPPGASSTGPVWVISDSGPLMTAVYSIVYYDDYSLVAPAVAIAGISDLVVWCAEDIPWEADAEQRDGPHMRAAAQQIIGGMLDDADLPFLRVYGPVPDRVAQVREYLAGAS
jgi:nicotinamide riboside kinase